MEALKRVQLKRLVVGKGKTSRAGDEEEWVKEYYEVEVLIEDPAELEVTRANVAGLIDGWLSPSKPVAKAPRALPQLDPGELAKFPWKTYRAKEPCKPDEAGWIFRNTPGAEALAVLIEKQGRGITVQIGQHEFEVKFSGAQKQFIGRAPVKTQRPRGDYDRV
jgi:hypothetical protein